MNENIFGVIRREINDFTNNSVEVVPGYTFNQYSTIKRIHLYTNSRFEDNTKYHGREKIFYNIVNYRRDSVMKSIDIDTKDVKVIPLNEESKLKTFIMQKEFQLWMKTNELGELFNESVEQLATYGSTVVKTTGTLPEIVDLRRFYVDPTVDKLKQSRFIIQEHFMTQSELQKMKGKWDDSVIKQVIKRFGSIYAPTSYQNGGQTNIQGTTPYYKIYERYGEVPRYMLEDDGTYDEDSENDLVRALFIVAEPFSTYKSNDTGVTFDNGLVLSKTKWEQPYPYEDCHYTKTKGRWLGIGPVEMLFPAQERVNELANQKRIAMELSSLHLFQTRDRTAPTNVATYMNSGDILIVNDEITPIATEERNLPAFANEEESYNQLADRLTFSYDAGRGEALPSSTPATNAVIQNNNVNSFFNLKRENFGLFWQRIFNNKISPILMKDLKPEHFLRFMGSPEDIARLDAIVSPYFVKEKMIDEVLNGNIVDNVRLEAIKTEISSDLKNNGVERYIQVIKDHYKDVEFEFDFVVTNEQRDTAVQANNMFMILQQLAQNPALIDDPVLRVVFYKYCEEIGIPPMELEVAGQQRQQMQQEQEQKMQMQMQQQQAMQQQGQPQQQGQSQSPQQTSIMSNPSLQAM